MKTSALALLALTSSASAFVPASAPAASTTQLNAESRREALGAMGLALGGLLLSPESSSASNPALQTFKGGKKTKGAFIPGKGLRSKEDELLASNPALETFKGGKKTKGAFIPGKGLRNTEEHDRLMAGLGNPALETFKGRKGTERRVNFMIIARSESFS